MNPHRILKRSLLTLAASVLLTGAVLSVVVEGPAGASPRSAFVTAAMKARGVGEDQERAGNYEQAAAAFERESGFWRDSGDVQAAQVEWRRAQRLKTDLAVAMVTTSTPPQTGLAKWEPVSGCYLGVLDEFASTYYGRTYGNTDVFSQQLGRDVAVAYDYQAYGRPFPFAWAQREGERGRAIQIAWEPNDIGAVRDNAYLNLYAEDAGRCGVPIFLRFGGEMNGAWTPWGRDPAAFRAAFRLVHAVMARHAPNVAMVWAPNDVPLYNLDQYYPGDDAVDWVGISVYLVRYYDDQLSEPGWQDSPATFIQPIYDKYASRKPICLVECGVTRKSHVEGTDADLFADARYSDLFDSIKIRFPRLKMLCFYDKNNIDGGPAGRRLNDFSLPQGSLALAAVRIAADSYFLGRVGSAHPGAPYRYQRIVGKLPSGYRGLLAASLSTYSLHPTIEIARGTKTESIHHPFWFSAPAGPAPIVITVRSESGGVAKVVKIPRS